MCETIFASMMMNIYSVQNNYDNKIILPNDIRDEDTRMEN